MYYSVRGDLIHADPKMAVIECGGVGYKCHITMNTARQLPPVGQEAMLYTVLNVREDALELFGFASQGELTCFKQLTAVSGVAAGDFKSLTKAQGVGAKLAQRIVLEMKDKVGALAPSGGMELPEAGVPGGVSAAGNAAEAAAALTVLGFTPGEAAAAVGRLDSALPVETLVREALKTLGKR